MFAHIRGGFEPRNPLKKIPDMLRYIGDFCFSEFIENCLVRTLYDYFPKIKLKSG